jgi:hypothetical protein
VEQKLIHVINTLNSQSKLLKTILKQLRKLSNNYDMLQTYCKQLGNRMSNIEETQRSFLITKDTDISEIMEEGGLEDDDRFQTTETKSGFEDTNS